MIDTHCHIHDQQFFSVAEADLAYSEAIREQIAMIVVGTSEPDSSAAVQFADNHEQVWSIVGVHPHESKHGWGGIAEIINSGSEKLVGIGEIGLDYYYLNSPQNVQQQALEGQLQMAVDFGLPVSFHVRDAFDDFWSIFDNFSSIRGVLHSFTDSQQNLERALTRNLKIGVNGISTFTKQPEQLAMYASVPLEAVLLETDAPFLTPVQYRGTINKPAMVKYIAENLALSHQVQTSFIDEITTANAKQLFGIEF